MPPAVVYVHIGSPKTGTTYLQNSLWDNREVLAAAGVLLPGRSRTVVGKQVSELLKWKPSAGELPVGWRRLADEITAWSGRAVIVSHEHLHKATNAQWEAIVGSLGGARIEVVLTARDVARSVPAQWQSSVRQRYTWTLGEYAAAVAAPGARQESSGAARHFWRRQDSPGILQRFLGRLPVEQLTVVTVPPSGGDPDELWRRFGQACGLTDVATTPGEVSHESLGAASSELMRRLNASAPVAGLSVSEYKKTINHALSRHALSPRRAEEPGLTLPDEHREWADAEAARLILGVEETGVEVIGDLGDLRPRPSTKPFVSPETLPAEDILDAAVAGLIGMSLQHVELRALLGSATAAAATRSQEAARAEAGEHAARTRTLGLERVLRRLQRGS